MKSIKVQPKRRGRPATGKDPLVGLRLPPDHIELIDKVAERDNRSRSEVIREAISDWLIGLGLLKLPPRDDQKH